MAWKLEAIYLGVFAADIIEDAHYRNKSVPKSDPALWTVCLDNGAPFSARIGGGREPIPNDPEIRLENRSGSNLDI